VPLNPALDGFHVIDVSRGNVAALTATLANEKDPGTIRPMVLGVVKPVFALLFVNARAFHFVSPFDDWTLAD